MRRSIETPCSQWSVGGLVRLTRYDEHLLFVVVTTLLGARAAGADVDWRLVLVLVANWLAVGFAFIINDVEDADDDARDRHKAARNPVSAGLVPARTGRVAALAVALSAAVAYLPLGRLPFMLGAATLGLGFLYSWRRVRLKAVPGIDLVAHGLLLAGLQFLCAARTFDPGGERPWLAPFGFVVLMSMYGQLFNQVRDLDGDLRAGIGHTVARIGTRVARTMMMTLLVLAGVLGLYGVVTGIVPPWVLAAGAVIGTVCLVGTDPRRVWAGTVEDLHGRVNVVGALTMIIWMVGDHLMG